MKSLKIYCKFFLILFSSFLLVPLLFFWQILLNVHCMITHGEYHHQWGGDWVGCVPSSSGGSCSRCKREWEDFNFQFQLDWWHFDIRHGEGIWRFK